MNELERRLVESGNAIEAAESEYRVSLDALRATLASGEAELSAAFESADQQADEFRNSVHELEAGLDRELGALTEAIRSLLQGAQTRIDATVTRIQGWQGDHETQLAAIGEEAEHDADGKELLLEELRQRVEIEVKQVLDVAVDELLESLAGMTTALEPMREGIEEGREPFSQRFESVNDLIEPLRAAVGAVKDAADDVGVRWAS
jgi:DNA repair exonuclease SbcCD ATPase subunit